MIHTNKQINIVKFPTLNTQVKGLLMKLMNTLAP